MVDEIQLGGEIGRHRRQKNIRCFIGDFSPCGYRRQSITYMVIIFGRLGQYVGVGVDVHFIKECSL